MQVAKNVEELIGRTPMVKLNRLTSPESARVLVKLEYFNPGGSIKDRTALGLIEEGERQGKLKPGSVIIEPTSGNTGVGLAMLAAVRGYRLILVMPETMSEERRRLLAAFGAEVILTPGAEGMQGAVDKALKIIKENPDYYLPQQFENPANPEAHQVTGREIYEQTFGRLDILVAGVGTGGTISGISRFLKKHLPEIKTVAVEPAGSAVIAGKQPGPHGIQGIGAGFIPPILDLKVLDEVITVTDEDALVTARRLIREEGILAGISTGAAVWAALKIAAQLDKDKVVVAVAPDTGERYLSTNLFDF